MAAKSKDTIKAIFDPHPLWDKLHLHDSDFPVAALVAARMVTACQLAFALLL